MARNSRSNGQRGSSSRSSRRKSDSQQGSGSGRGWHGDPQGHAKAARGEEVRGDNDR